MRYLAGTYDEFRGDSMAWNLMTYHAEPGSPECEAFARLDA